MNDFSKYTDDLNSIDIFPTGKIFRLIYDNVVNSLRIISKNRDYLEEIRTSFSVKNKSAFFSQQYGYKGEDRLYNINQFGFFSSGLVWKIFEWIKTQYGSLNCVAISKNCASYISEILTPLKNCKMDFEISNVSDDTGRNAEIRARMTDGCDDKLHEFRLRPYQREAVENIFFKGYGRGLIEVPTAGGKSLILATYIWNMMKNVDRRFKFMILVPNVQLVEQFCGDLVDYGFDRRDIAKFEGGMSKREKNENNINTAKIIIANRQYVFKNKNMLPDIDVLICDEVHQTLSKASAELITQCRAKYKVGCTGTLPSDKYQLNQLIGMFGNILFEEKITNLQDEGFISKLHITSLRITDKSVEADRSLLFHVNSTKKYIADDIGSNDMRFDDAVRAEHEYFAKWYKELYSPVLDYIANKLTGNTLVLFDKLDIGESIYEHFKETYPNINSFYNDGSTNVKERESVRAGLENAEGNVLFANVQIMSTGVSIKRLHNIVFCFSSKSKVRCIQSIGRILRLYDGKDYARLIDVSYNFKYSQRHYKERLQLYRDNYNKSKPDEIINIEI